MNIFEGKTINSGRPAERICDSLDYLTLGASPSQAPPSERGKLLAAENRKKLCMWQGVGLGSTLIEPIRQRGKLNFFEHFLTIL